MSNHKLPEWSNALAFLGLIFAAIGLTGCIFWHQIFYKLLDMQLALSPNVVYYSYWKNPSDPVIMNVYFFNWTNPEEFLNLSTKPSFKQCGPYSFTERPAKIDINWHSGNDSVSYRKKSYYYFEAERSKGNLDDKIVALNAVAMTAARQSKEMNAAQSRMVSMGLDLFGHQRHVIRTVDELFISGYSDNVIAMAKSIPIFGKHENVPDRFGWFYGNNGSSDVFGSFNVHTGAKNASIRGQIHTWNFAKHTGFYKSNCGRVHGSTGEFYGTNVTPQSIIYIFSPELCRHVPLEYTETVEIEGIMGYKFTAGLRYVDNGTLYPENVCFCQQGKCHPSGITDVSACRFGAPLFVSLPHFHQADPYYINSLEGMQPNARLHELYVVVEPRSGATLEVAARLQINMLVEPVSNVRLFRNVPRVFFPLIWMESKFRIGPEKVSEVKMMNFAFWSGYGVAIVMFALGVLLLYFLWFRSDKWKSNEKGRGEVYKDHKLVTMKNDNRNSAEYKILSGMSKD